MTMLWPSSRQWAPNLVVSVQSRPCFLIETWFYCVVALTLCVALVAKHWGRSKGVLLGAIDHGPAAPASPPPLLQGPDANAALEGAHLLADAGAGDGVGADQRPWPPPSPREVPATPGLDAVYVACAACQRAHSVGAVFLASASSSGLLSEDDKDLDDMSVLSVDDSTLEDDRSSEMAQEREQTDWMQGNMMEYVAGRYQGLKKAALAGTLMDPSTSTLKGQPHQG